MNRLEEQLEGKRGDQRTAGEGEQHAADLVRSPPVSADGAAKNRCAGTNLKIQNSRSCYSMLFWAAVIVESYTSYGLSRADPFVDCMQELAYPFNAAVCCGQSPVMRPRRSAEF
jgi:hypothetical protein